ncbi:hypothetical protein O181_125135 [Austropuccinia psidii MF-1]|uniref:DUF4939 domain-containing protein n=1 Tax=Austropuccinia psidii MF-1 TaxID=1389203 RepID=A0A9Q3KP54_9BASI|nr:hypothetical protein [Austropuccinia psidii MF-1]
MPIQNSTPERQTRSQARAQAVLTPTPRAPIDGTPSVPQLRTQYEGPSRTTFKGPGEDGEEEEENSVEEEESEGTEGVPAPCEPSLLAIMQKMTQIMANLQAASSSEESRPPAFKPPSMKAPECFNGTQPFKVRSFIQSCKLIFHNYLENFSQERKKIIYSTSFPIGRALKWIKPYLSNLANQDPSYLLN